MDTLFPTVEFERFSYKRSDGLQTSIQLSFVRTPDDLRFYFGKVNVFYGEWSYTRFALLIPKGPTGGEAEKVLLQRLGQTDILTLVDNMSLTGRQVQSCMLADGVVVI